MSATNAQTNLESDDWTETPSVRRRTALELEVRAFLDRGDLSGATQAILEGYGPELLGYLLTTIRDRVAAQDIFADVCMDLWSGIAAYRGSSSVRTWLYVIAHHAALRHARKEQRMRRRFAPPAELDRLVQEVRSVTRSYAKTERRDQLARIRDAMDPADQVLLVLRVDKTMSWDDIVLIVEDQSPSSNEGKRAAARLRKRFERIKDELQRRFVDEGLAAWR